MKTMMRCLVVVIFVGAITTQLIGQWVQTSGYGNGATITALAVSGTNIFAGTDNGVYLSTNNGTNWTAVNSGFAKQYSDSSRYEGVRVLAVMGTNLFAGVWGGVFLSTNNGTSWTAVNSGLTNINVYSLAISGTNLFAGTYDGGVYLSTDNGAKWTTVNTGLPYSYNNTVFKWITFLAVTGTDIYACTYGRGIYRSTDDGAHWTAVNSGLDGYIRSLTGYPNGAGGYNLVAGSFWNGAYLSTNNSTGWTAVNNGLPKDLSQQEGMGYYEISAFANIGTNLFAGTANAGVFLSTNNGSNWTKVNTGVSPIRISALTTSGNNIFAGTEGGGVFLSANNGANWTAVNVGLPPVPLPTVNTFFDSGVNLFAGTEGGLYSSAGIGTNWNITNADWSGMDVHAFATSGTYLFAGTSHRGIFRSIDKGAHLSSVNNGLTNQSVRALAVSGLNIFAGTDSGGFLSSDFGATWTSTIRDTFSVTSLAVSGDTIYAGTDKGFLLTTNGGYSWINAGLSDILAVTVIPKKDGGTIIFVIVAGREVFSGNKTNHGRIYRSTDNGATWESLRAWGMSLACTDTILFVGGYYDGILISSSNQVNKEGLSSGFIDFSKDYGDTWNDFGMELTSVPALIVKDRQLFAAAIHLPGIWRRPLSEMNTTTDSLLVPVTGGTFTAGTTPVTISSFKMDKYEVTYELWTAVRNWALTHGYTDLAAGKNGYNPVGANNPVDSVNWYDVVKWCNARSEKDGLTPVYYTRSAQDTVYRIGQININIDAVKWTANGYRLPTEAEWEFAARGGNFTHGYTYSGSNTLDSVAWYYDNSGEATHTVGTKKANEFGIYDMSGNVFEWCWDWYGSAYPSGGTTDPKGPSTTQSSRLLRGGSFVNASYDPSGYVYACRVANRSNYNPVLRNYTLALSVDGFRCVQGSQVGTAVNGETNTPQTFVLEQNYPNPFNPSTTITFSIPERSTVRLSIFNTLGQKISEMVNETKDAGFYEHNFHASQLSSGIYFYRIEATSVSNSKTFVETKKMILMK